MGTPDELKAAGWTVREARQLGVYVDRFPTKSWCRQKGRRLYRRAFYRHPGRSAPSQTGLRFLRLRCSSCYHRGGEKTLGIPEHPNGSCKPKIGWWSPKESKGGRRSCRTGCPKKEVDFQARLILNVSCILLQKSVHRPKYGQ